MPHKKRMPQQLREAKQALGLEIEAVRAVLNGYPGLEKFNQCVGENTLYI